MGRKKIRVLLIEDEENDVELIEESLNRDGQNKYEIEARNSVRNLTRTSVQLPDIILTDLRVIDSSGIGTFRTVYHLFSDVPIVVLSGNEDVELARLSVKEGAQDFVTKDITHLQLLERTIMYAIERHKTLKEIQALNLKTSEFSARIGQELDRIIVSVLACVDRLRRRYPDDQDALSIEESSQRAVRLAQSMMAYAGRLIGQKKLISLNQEILDNEYLFFIECGEIELKIDLCPEQPNIMGEGVLIRDIIRALLANSIEAIGSRKGEIKLTTTATADRALLTVEDNGPGIDESIADKIYEPFFTTKYNRHGLGLASVQGIMKSHLGEISHTSIPGCTKFVLSWPRVIDDPKSDQ